MLTNTVPYKPPGNKAYATSVKERFRPFLCELLAVHWRGGEDLITLGTEAFQWFKPYMKDSESLGRVTLATEEVSMIEVLGAM